jgi:hypothetical protein
MTKSNADRRSRTHFEQIPLEVVKKIALVESPDEQRIGPDNLVLEPASQKTEPYSVRAEALSRRRR